MRLSFSHGLEIVLMSAITLSAANARAGLIFDLASPGVNVRLEYEVDGYAFAEFPHPDVEEITLHRRASAQADNLVSFWDADDVGIFFGFMGPIESRTFLLDFVALVDVPAFGRTSYLVNPYADNFEGNGFAIGQVVVDAPNLLVLSIAAGHHGNIPVFPELTWDGTFTITATGVPEPATTALTAAGLLACAAWRSRRKRSRDGRISEAIVRGDRRSRRRESP